MRRPRKTQVDSARSWAVAVACCWINLFTLVVIRSAGVIYVGILQAYNVSREQAAWPTGLSGICYCLMGPVAGILARHISIWKLTLVGCMLGSLAVSVCFFAEDIAFLAVFLGIIHGLSIGLPALFPVVINQHFRRYRAAASGISYAGTSIGGLLFPTVINALFETYGVRGTFLLLGALMLNSTAAAFLQRYPPEQDSTSPTVTPQASSDRDPMKALVVKATSDETVLTDSSCKAEAIAVNGRHDYSVALFSTDAEHKCCAKGSAPVEDVRHGPRSPSTDNGLQNTETNDDRIVSKDVISSDTMDCKDNEEDRRLNVIKTNLDAKPFPPNEREPHALQIPHMNCNRYTQAAKEDKCIMNKEGLPLLERLSPSTPPCLQKCADQKARGRDNFLSFLLCPKYYLIALSYSQILGTMTSYVTVIVDFATDRNIERWSAVSLISSYTISDLVARLGSGWITDKGFLSRGTMMGSHLLIWGATLCLMPACNMYSYQLALSVLCGWCNGCTMILVAVLFTDLVGLVKLGVCLGVATFGSGMLGLASPPIVGYFRDTRGDYEGLFYLRGGILVLLAFIWLCLSVKDRCHTRFRISKSTVSKVGLSK